MRPPLYPLSSYHAAIQRCVLSRNVSARDLGGVVRLGLEFGGGVGLFLRVESGLQGCWWLDIGLLLWVGERVSLSQIVDGSRRGGEKSIMIKKRWMYESATCPFFSSMYIVHCNRSESHRLSGNGWYKV